MASGRQPTHEEVGIGAPHNLDAFDRLRVSPPETIFDSKQLFDNAPLLWDDQEVSGTGTTSVHSVDTASSVLSVGTGAGKRVRQTFMRFNYQPGKSQLIYMTGTLSLSGGGTGVICAFGAFDDENGIFWTSDEGTVKVVIRSKTTGSVVDTEVDRADWDDPMDGTGESGINLDFTKSQLLVIDYEWLSVGTVRIGVFIEDEIIYFHRFNHANVIEGPYMSTPNLPLRYSIESLGTGVVSSMRHICTTVISEGGIHSLGVLHHASTAGAGVTTDAEDELFAVIGVRLKSTHLGAQIFIVSTGVQIHTASEFGQWVLILNPTVAGTFTYANRANSAIQVALGGGAANSVTGGDHVTGGYLETGGGNTGGSSETGTPEDALLLGSAIDGTPDTIVLCYRPINGTSVATVEGDITWREAS